MVSPLWQKMIAFVVTVLLGACLLFCLLLWYPAVLIALAVVGYALVSLAGYSDLRARIFKGLSE